MKFDGGFGRAKSCPRKEREAQIDRAGVQGVDVVFQLEVEIICRYFLIQYLKRMSVFKMPDRSDFKDVIFR